MQFLKYNQYPTGKNMYFGWMDGSIHGWTDGCYFLGKPQIFCYIFVTVELHAHWQMVRSSLIILNLKFRQHLDGGHYQIFNAINNIGGALQFQSLNHA